MKQLGNTALRAAGAVMVAAACAACTHTATPPPVTPPPAPASAPAPGSGSGSASVPAGPVPTVAAVPTGRAGQPRGAGAFPAFDPASAESVAATFAAVTFTYDTAIDRSVFDAQARSAAYATRPLAAQLRQPLANTGNAQWTALVAHHGFTTVALKANADDGRPPDGLNTAARAFTVTVTGSGDGGWAEQLSSTTMYLFLSRTAATAPWQVARVSFGSGQ